ncbi:RNA polymerase sigma factor [Robertkochia solimangrovi]|uniref:RNA polymerase sigma factor n=1 Tax=Robertkochia solimangrovi TaxID=2213046 RepID=UPI00117F3C0D|nr:RNA polymerase sigma factor [Robertkochia solimangrovi]TRZ45986.1 RNA polymerase subunit sigma-70 [Robertkochia solimangrovi]
MSLEQLVEECKKQDRKAQEQLYRLFGNKLYSVCLKYSRNFAEAEDNLQDSFLTIFNKIGTFNFRGSLEGWMRRIAVNTVLQKYRKEGVFDVLTTEIPDEIQEVEITDNDLNLEYLLQLIQELPDRYRLCFNLYVLDGYSHKEIASMLEISEGTSKSNLARAKIILRNKIEDDNLNKKANSF